MNESSTAVTIEQKRPPVEAGTAIIECVEQHSGEKFPDVGPRSILCPNLLRINGVAIWATYHNPVVIRGIQIGGGPGEPFAVTVQLHARALRFNVEPAYDTTAEGDLAARANAGAVVEVPDVEEFTSGEVLERPYVLLNGRRIYIQGPIVVGEMAANGVGEHSMATVVLTLLCRRFIVDDEPYPAGKLPVTVSDPGTGFSAS